MNYETQKAMSTTNCKTLNEVYSLAAKHYRVQIKQREVSGKNKKKVEDSRMRNVSIDKRVKIKEQDPGVGKPNFGGSKGGSGQGNRSQGSSSRDPNAERVYNCKRCGKNHPGVNCQGQKVHYFNYGKAGYRAYECFAKGSGNQQGQEPKSSGSHHQVGGGSGQASKDSTRKEEDRQGHKGKIYVVNKAQTQANEKVTGIFPINSLDRNALFDYGVSN